MNMLKRLIRVPKDIQILLDESEAMMLIMHNLIQDLHYSGESHRDHIMFSNVLHKALEGHHEAIKNLINVDEGEIKLVRKRTPIKSLYNNRFVIFPKSKKKRRKS